MVMMLGEEGHREIKGIRKDFKTLSEDFSGSPVVKPHFHCRGHRFNPWSGN